MFPFFLILGYKNIRPMFPLSFRLVLASHYTITFALIVQSYSSIFLVSNMFQSKISIVTVLLLSAATFVQVTALPLPPPYPHQQNVIFLFRLFLHFSMLVVTWQSLLIIYNTKLHFLIIYSTCIYLRKSFKNDLQANTSEKVSKSSIELATLKNYLKVLASTHKQERKKLKKAPTCI
jgi:hypothetical protein